MKLTALLQLHLANTSCLLLPVNWQYVQYLQLHGAEGNTLADDTSGYADVDDPGYDDFSDDAGSVITLALTPFSTSDALLRLHACPAVCSKISEQSLHQTCCLIIESTLSRKFQLKLWRHMHMVVCK